MNKFITLDERGEIVATATIADDDDVDEYIRLNPNAIQVDPEDDDDDIIANRYIKNGEWRWRPPAPTTHHYWDFGREAWVEDTEGERQRTLRKVDEYAETARSSLATPGQGQAMVYEAKYREAQAGGGSMLQAEAEALGVTEQEVVGSVLKARAKWEQANARIEAARVRAKKLVREAIDAEEMHGIVGGLDDWTILAG